MKKKTIQQLIWSSCRTMHLCTFTLHYNVSITINLVISHSNNVILTRFFVKMQIIFSNLEFWNF